MTRTRVRGYYKNPPGMVRSLLEENRKKMKERNFRKKTPIIYTFLNLYITYLTPALPRVSM